MRRRGGAGDASGGLLLPLLRGQNHRHHAVDDRAIPVFHARAVGEICDDAIEDSLGCFRPRCLSPAEHDGHLDLVAVRDESPGMSYLRLDVMRVGRRSELEFLHLDRVLLFSGRALLLLKLVAILAPVHDAHDRRPGLRRDLHEIQAGFLRCSFGLVERNDAYLLSFRIDEANGAYSDRVVDANLLGGANGFLLA